MGMPVLPSAIQVFPVGTRAQRGRDIAFPLLWASGAGGLNFDFSTGALDPRITYTRGSQATQYDSSGNLMFSPTNLCPRSQQLIGGAGWFLSQVTLVDSGVPGLFGSNFSLMTISAAPTDPYIRQNVAAGSGFIPGAYVAQTWYVKRGNQPQACLRGVGVGGSVVDNASSYNFDTDTVTVNTAVSCTRTLLPNGVVRLRQVIKTDITNTSYEGRIKPALGAANAGDTVLVSDPQYELVTDPNATALPYINTGTGAAIYQSRFDNDPISKLFKGWLIEEARTNGIRNSSNNGASVGSPGTLPTNMSVGGLGGLSSSVVAVGVANGFSYWDVRYQGTMSANGGYLMQFDSNSAIAAAQNDNWAVSCFLALVGGNFTNVTSITHDLVQYPGGIDIATGFVNLRPSIDGTLRRFSSSCQLTLVGCTNVQPRLQFSATNGTAVDFTLRYAWPQCELGAFATSPIPTYTTAQTRNADVATMSANPWYTQGDGTVSTEFIPEGLPSDAIEMQLDDGGNNNRVLLDYIPTSFARTTVSGVGQHSIVGAVLVAGTIYKHAFGIAAVNAKVGLNGTLYGPSSASIPTTITTLRLGSGVGGAVSLNGWLRKFNYYTSRLPDAQLQSITTPDYPLYMVAAAAAFSYRRLKFDYPGKAALIQRDSDSTSIDVGFVGNDFDAASYNAFVTTFTGRTKTWYDQANSNNVAANPAAGFPVTFSHVPDDHGRWGGFTTGGSLSYMSAADNTSMQNCFATGGYLIVVLRNENEASTGALISKGSTAGWEINIFKNATNDWRLVWYIKGATTDGFWVMDLQVTPNVLHVVTVEYNASTPTVSPVITLDGAPCSNFIVQNPVGAVMNDTGQPLVAFNNNVSDVLNNAVAGGVYEAILVKGSPSALLKAALLANVKAYYAIP